MHKNPIKAKFIISSPDVFIKPMAGNITSIFRFPFREIQSYKDKLTLFTGINTFWVVQNNIPVIDTMNKLNKRKILSSILAFEFSTLHTKVPITSLGWYFIVWLISALKEEKANIYQYITAKSYGARGEKISKIM